MYYCFCCRINYLKLKNPRYKNEDFLFILYYYSTATILFFPILLAKYIASSALEIRVNKSIVNSKA